MTPRRVSRSTGPDGSQRGQSSVEFALLLPVLAFGAWLPLAAGSLALARMDLAHLARTAAREGAMSATPSSAARRVVASAGGGAVQVRADVRAGILLVTVSGEFRMPLPLPPALRPPIRLEASAAASTEIPLIGMSVVEASVTDRGRAFGRLPALH